MTWEDYTVCCTINVKVYEQRRTVNYADYQIGMFYIAPANVIIKT